MTPEEVEEAAVKIVMSYAAGESTSEELKRLMEDPAIANRVVEIFNGSPFKMKIDASRWFGVWGTKG